MPAMPPAADWSYTVPTDMTDSLNVVRYFIQDTDPNVRLLGDSEINFLVNAWSAVTDSIIEVAAQACELIATKMAGVVTVSADGVAVDVADISTRYAGRAQTLRQTALEFSVGDLDISNLLWGQDWDWSIDPLQFGIGFQDNVEAGRQNYGTERWDTSHASYEDRVGWL